MDVNQIENIKAVFENQKKTASVIAACTVRDRKEKLISLRKWIWANRQKIREACFADFKKPEPETDLTEIKPVLSEIDHVLNNLSSWMKPVKVKAPLALKGTRSKIITEPAGQVLILAPWNFPFNLTLGPMISAIAAGNVMIVKPSEFAPTTSALIEEMAQEIFSDKEVYIANGDYKVAEFLLTLNFNHIFFTGSPQIGKKVMKAAAEHLCSVTLELGGVNPVVVDETADLQDAAEKLAFGKCMNAGQSCLAPNTLYVQESVKDKFLSLLIKFVEKMYGVPEHQKRNPDFGRIVNKNHFQRVSNLINQALLKGATLVYGGFVDESDNFISPSIIDNVNSEMDVLREEIFGPVLPVVPFKDKKDIPPLLKDKSTSLALYIFSDSDANIEYYISNISAGTTAINETTLQFMHPELPFGGKNYSGIGKAHGYYGFKAFSHERAILRQRRGITSFKLIYPPYTPRVKKIINLILKYI